MPRLRPSAFAVLIWLVASSGASPAYAYCRSRTIGPPDGVTCSEMGEVHFYDRGEIPMLLHERGARDLSEDEVRGALRRSIATWMSVDCEGFAHDFEMRLEDVSTAENCARFPGNTADLRPGCAPQPRDDDNVNTIVFAQDWTTRGHEPAAFAVTTVWSVTSTGRVLGADIEMNEQFMEWAICPDAGCTDMRADLENVATHELGHVLGLGHSAIPAATMRFRSRAGETIRRDLASDDVAGFCEVAEDLRARQGGGCGRCALPAPRRPRAAPRGCRGAPGCRRRWNAGGRIATGSARSGSSAR